MIYTVYRHSSISMRASVPDMFVVLSVLSVIIILFLAYPLSRVLISYYSLHITDLSDLADVIF